MTDRVYKDDWLELREITRLPERLFFTSDTHFGHAKVLEYCQRPYRNIEEHDETLINNWNRVVPEDGIVFHLGDFAFGNPKFWGSLLDRLHGTKILIIGNHDRRGLSPAIMDKFKMCRLQVNCRVEEWEVMMNHYPFMCYPGTYPGRKVCQLFGHLHSGSISGNPDNEKAKFLHKMQIDVGVDGHNFTPYSWGEIKDLLKEVV